MKKSFYISVITSLFFLLAINTYAQTLNPKIHPDLQNVINNATDGELIRVYVIFEDRLGYVYFKERTKGMTRESKRQFVTSTLKQHAANTQTGVKNFLNQNTSNGKVLNVQIIWAINTISFQATPEVIIQLAENYNEIEKIHYDPQISVEQLIDYKSEKVPDKNKSIGSSNNNPFLSPQQGLILINAVNVWPQGDSGKGVIVANLDTGCDWDHPDLVHNIWNNLGEDADGDGHTIEFNGSSWQFDPGDQNNIDDDGNGKVDDFYGWDFQDNDNNPQDTHGHGTQTSGLVAGDGTGGTQTGVAPRAKLMILRPNGESEYWLASQYAVDNGANVITSSLSYKWYFSPQPNYPMFREMTDIELAAGVIHSNSTSNDGNNLGSAPIPYNISAPGNCPTAWIHPDQDPGGLSSVIGVGNVDAFSDVIESSSPHGPAAWEDIQANHPGYPYEMPLDYQDYPYETVPGSMGLLKPDVSAPGSNTTSTTLGGGYGSFGGTSGATPHVAGTIALMLEGNPFLEPSDVSRIIQSTAIEKGAPGKDSRYGAGRIDAYDAWYQAIAELNPDTIPPTRVTDLMVIDTTSNSLTLTWTVPFDTSTNGIVGYDIRMSDSPILDSLDFYSATQIPFGQMPDTIGATETLVVGDLNFATVYYFALKANDFYGNYSAISNNAEGETWGPPVVDVDPAFVDVNLQPGTEHTEIVELSNISAGNSTLDFQISLENNTFPEDMISYKLVPDFNRVEKVIDKNQRYNGKGGAVRGSGGPDQFGYEWIDSEEPNGPQYVWDDISATGNVATNWSPTGTWDPKDEGYSGPYSLGFDFDFYGISHNQVYIGSNGLFTFEPLTENTYTNDPIPDTDYPNDFIAPFWDDLDGSDQGTVYYLQDGNRFIIQFDGWGRFSGSGDYTFQLVLYSSGKILVYYENMSGETDGATVGIENPDGTDGLNVAYNSTYVQNGLALKFSAEPDWLESDLTEGTIYNGNSMDIELTFRTEDFPIGEYSMDMVIASNDPQNPELVVPVTMTNSEIPVELSTFSATVDRNNVLLKWKTATETNNQGFRIERKLQEQTEWTEISYIKGAGSTTEIQSYSFNDKKLKPGKYSYRLKQIDYDGSFEYSNNLNVSVAIPDEYTLYQNYPNPFNPATTIEYSLPEDANVKINIYSVIGELVKTLINGNIEAGYQKVEFDASNLPSGTYIYRIEAKGKTNNFVDTKKMMLIK